MTTQREFAGVPIAELLFSSFATSIFFALFLLLLHAGVQGFCLTETISYSVLEIGINCFCNLFFRALAEQRNCFSLCASKCFFLVST